MLKTEELRNPTSCLNKAEADEPVFVLRAKDPVAPQTIRHWVTMAAGTHDEGKRSSAHALADQMERWRNRQYPEATPEDKR